MRIVSLAPSNTEIVFALGAEANLVGVTTFCDFPPAAKSVPRVGSWTAVSAEKIVSLLPDVVLTSGFLQDPVVEELRARKLSVCHVDPRDLRGVAHSFEIVGAAVGQKAAGRRLKRVFLDQIAALRRQKKEQSPKVLVLEWLEPLTPAGNWVPELIEAAGGVSVLAKKGMPSTPASAQAIVTSNPEILVLSICGKGDRVEFSAVPSALSGIAAVRKHRVRVVDDSLLNRPGPRLIEGARWLFERMRGAGRTAARGTG